jgi:hypothetical protein
MVFCLMHMQLAAMCYSKPAFLKQNMCHGLLLTSAGIVFRSFMSSFHIRKHAIDKKIWCIVPKRPNL